MQIFNIFPTTIYVGEVENHSEYKEEFLKLYVDAKREDLVKKLSEI